MVTRRSVSGSDEHEQVARLTMAGEAPLDRDVGESATRDEFGRLVKRFQDGAFGVRLCFGSESGDGRRRDSSRFSDRLAPSKRLAGPGSLRCLASNDRSNRMLSLDSSGTGHSGFAGRPSPAAEPRVDETHLRDLGLTLLQAIAALPEDS